MIDRSSEQLVQEAQYRFPYHYLDLEVDICRLRAWEYVSLLHTVTETVRAHGRTVLDAGCGDGRLCRELQGAGLTVTGVDFSDRAVAFARAFNPDLEFVVADLEDLDLGRTFDVVVLMEALEHLRPEQTAGVLERVAAHLAPHGHLVVTVPSDKIPVAEKHYRHFSPATLVDVLDPWFQIVALDGYFLQGARAEIFQLLRRIAYILAPLKPVPPFNRLVDIPPRYYERHLRLGPPDRSAGLIATCVSP